ncbi:MAG TPA: DUF4825 domain-containing protein [Metalysinibacillus sp.]
MRYLLAIVLLLGGCASTSLPTPTPTNELLLYRDTLIGDNSNVLAIIYDLPEARNFLQLELHTAVQPYSASLKYDEVTHPKIVSIANATWLFTLIPNVDSLQFTFDTQSYTLTREQVISWYGKDFTTSTTEADIQLLIDAYTADPAEVDALFET